MRSTRICQAPRPIRHRRLGLVLALALLIPVAGGASYVPTPKADTDPPVVLVLPAEWKASDTAPVLRARIADSSGVGRVTAWVMGIEDDDYRAVTMRPDGRGNFVAEMPPPAGGADAMVFFVEAWDVLGNGPRRGGDPANPFVVRTAEAESGELVESRAAVPRVLVFGLLLAPLALLWVMYRQDRRERERDFWFALVRPIASRRGPELNRALEGLSAQSHRHPYRGEIRTSPIELRRWVRLLVESGEIPSSTPAWPVARGQAVSGGLRATVTVFDPSRARRRMDRPRRR